MMNRSRIWYGGLAMLVVSAGLLSRSKRVPLPGFVSEYAGDTLWALLVFVGLGLLWPTLSTWRAALLAGAFSLFIELSQLIHTPWLDALRENRFARLVLGQGFLWSDLLCYAVGLALGAAIELMLRARWQTMATTD